MRRFMIVLSLTALLAASKAAAAPATGGVAGPEPLGLAGSHDLCGVEIPVSDRGRFFTGYTPSPDWDFTVGVGLWVGARADRGQGSEISVSTGYFSTEFFPPDTPLRGDPAFQTVYVDTVTPEYLPDHHPLGLEVTQQSLTTLAPGEVHAVDVKFSIRNISHEYAPPGWTLEDVYLGTLVDGDIGRGEGVFFWQDDLGGFVSASPNSNPTIAPGARRGDLAYLYDAPGAGDDVDTQFGVALLHRDTHAFRIWAGGSADPMNDLERYAKLRGFSDDLPTIDPNPIVPNDYRFLLSTGPIPSIAPGETVTFSVALECGALVKHLSVEPALATPIPHDRDRVVSRAAASVSLGDGSSAVEIFSIAGRRVARVAKGVAWDLRTDTGSLAPAGVYFWRPATSASVAGKIVLTR